MASLSFKLPSLHTSSEPPKAFLPNDAKQRYFDGSHGLRGYLPGNSSLVEILASRYFYVLNFCLYGKESILVSLVRSIGWGARIAFYLFSLIFVCVSLTTDPNPISQYGFSRERNDEGVLKNDDTDPFEWFVTFTYAVWLASILTEVLSYVVGRGGGGKKPHENQCSAMPLLFFNRVSINGDGDDGMRCVQGFFILVWFLSLGASASAMLYCIVSHTFVKRNFLFGLLLVVLTCFSALGALADAVSLGGVDGLAVQNGLASWLSAARVVVFVPLTVIFSVFFLWLSSPPWSSI